MAAQTSGGEATNVKSLVKKLVDVAFKVSDDLKETITLKATTRAFDFSTGITSTDSYFEDVEVIPSTIEKSDEVHKLRLTARSIPDISIFDTVVFRGVDWKVGEVISHNEFVTKFWIYKNA